ncbi:ethanolamine ammonia-lyase subunit EutC, partial [Mesorhizobium sp. M00.F.Ca.ET.186.01.1.1]
ACEASIPDLLPALQQGLAMRNISVGKPIFINKGRVWIQDQVAKIVGCKVVISLIGERPGLATAESLSAYMIYKPDANTVESDRTVISNIHRGGTLPIEAGAYLAELLEEILKYQASGVKYMQLRAKNG